MEYQPSLPSRTLWIPIEDLTGVIDAFRSIHDPLSPYCPPHITVVFPFQSEVGTDKIAELMTSICTNRLSFTLKLGPPQQINDHLILLVNSQQKWLFEIHQKLSKKCKCPPSLDFIPRIIMGRNLSDLANFEFGDFPKSLQVIARALVLEEIPGVVMENQSRGKVLLESKFREAR